MQVLRLNEVLSRVVAWHNRHPLARRIKPSQVHSIGEVLLPFASAQAVASTVAAAPPLRSSESLAAVVSARAAARPAQVVPGLDVHTLHPEDDAAWAAEQDPYAPEPTRPMSEDADLLFAAAVPEPGPADIDLSDPGPAAANADEADSALPAGADTPAEAAAEADPGDAPDPPAEDGAATGEASADERPLPTLTDAVSLAPGDDSLPPSTHPAAPAGDAPADAPADPLLAAMAQATAGRPPTVAELLAAAPEPLALPPAKPDAEAVRPGWLARLRARLGVGRRGPHPALPRLESAFSANFCWPLSPRAVARWARRHGQLPTLAPPDWPRRQIAPDPAVLARWRQKGLSQTVHLHVLTAAIGVGDRRIRVLMDAQGRIIGPRAYSRPRVAGATGLLLCGAVAGVLGSGAWWPAPGDEAASVALAAAPAASAASAALLADGASSPAGPASAAEHLAAAALPASAPASATEPPHAADSAVALAAAASPAAASAVPPTGTAPHPNPDTPAVAPVAALAPADADDPVPDTAGTPASGTLGRIRPGLSEEDKRAARAQAARLRGDPPPAPVAAAPVYAVVTRPSRQREAAAKGLALMQAAGARLPPPAPSHGELMQSQGEWRAAWWPFSSLADAERARVLLAGRGLKAEVVEF